jgi:hypothetical protein
MFQRSPLSLMGWLALLAALGSAGLAVVAVMLPSVDDVSLDGGICPLDGAHTLPSGRAAELCDILPETQPFTSVTWLVVRMVVPDLPGPGVESTHTDHDWICAQIALPEAQATDPPPARVIVQLMAEPFIRGEPAPGITQSIEAYTLHDGACIWELL